MNTEYKKEESTTLFASSHPDIAKRMNYKLAILASLYIEIGIVLFIMAYLLNQGYNTLSMCCLVAGFLLILFGVYKVSFRSKREIYLPTGSAVEKQTLFFDSKQLPLLRECIDKEEFPLEAPVQCVANGCVKMEVLRTEDGRFAGAQLFEFVPYVYTPVTPVHYCTEEKAESLSKFVQSIKSKSA